MEYSWKRLLFIMAAILAGFIFAPCSVFAQEAEPIEIEEESSSALVEETQPIEIVEQSSETLEETEAASEQAPDSSLELQAHVANIGWMEETSDEQITGTTGQSLGMEALTIELDSSYEGDIHYQAHVANIGWQESVENGEIAGTTGKALSIEAIRIWLTGDVFDQYDIYYRAHVANIGWMGWTGNGGYAGSQGRGYAMEALEVRLIRKGESKPTSDTNAFSYDQMETQVHVANVGWMNPVFAGNYAGTTGQGNAIEGVKIQFTNPLYSGGVKYRTYVEKDGWQDYKENNELSGTTGQSKHIEAIQISLTGEMAEHYDIFYQPHVANIGWMGWAKNGESAGSLGYGYGIEALNIRLMEKDVTAPSNRYEAFDTSLLEYNAHVANVGWTDFKKSGSMLGDVYNAIEAFSAKIHADYDMLEDGHIQYRSYVSTVGWEDEWAQDGEMSGTQGKALGLQAIQMRLTGAIADKYNIFYRTCVQKYGWLDWSGNGHIAGTEDLSSVITGIQFSLVSTEEKPAETGSEVSYITKNSAQRDGKEMTGTVRTNSGHFEITVGQLEDTTAVDKRLILKQSVQENRYYCSPACVQMILDYYGIHVSQTQLAQDMGTSPWGTGYEPLWNTTNAYLFGGNPKPGEPGYRLQTDFSYNREVAKNQLKNQVIADIDEGRPLLIMLELSTLYPNMPYACHQLIITGYKYDSNDDDTYYYLIDPYYRVQDPIKKGLKIFSEDQVLDAIYNNFIQSLVW